MPFKNGKQKTGGRQKGVQNLFTRTVKETVLEVFKVLQSDPNHNLQAFAKKNPKIFYLIAAKLIPTELTGKDGATLVPPINIVVNNSDTETEIKKLVNGTNGNGSLERHN